jgi:cysteine desulfurase
MALDLGDITTGPATRYVYLDYAASSPVRPEALEVARQLREQPWADANPNSLHTLGRQAAQALEAARHDLARALGGGFRPNEVVFTSGGTESDNLAVLGIAEGMRAADRKRTKVVISAIEHHAVLNLAAPLREWGFEVVLVRPTRSGIVTADALAEAIDETCALVSVMAANNETGKVQPIGELARIAHDRGARFHTDAVQAFAKVPLDLADVDAVSVTGHKIGASVGIGALAIRSRCPYKAQSFGGGQEFGRRSGTQDVEGALQLAAVATALMRDLPATRETVAERARALYRAICTPSSGIVPTTDGEVGDDSLPGTVNVLVDGVDSETLILRLDAQGFEVSAASACSSGSLDPSHVLSAMGIPRNQALGSLRISFDERVSQADLDSFADALLSIVGAASSGPTTDRSS